MGLNPTSDGARFRGRSGCVYPLEFGAHFDRSAEPPPAVVKVKYPAAAERGSMRLSTSYTGRSRARLGLLRLCFCSANRSFISIRALCSALLGIKQLRRLRGQQHQDREMRPAQL